MCVCSSYYHNYYQSSLSSGPFPDLFKTCSVHPLLKKPNLDKEVLGNYRTVSYLSFYQNSLKKIVKNRLIDHLFSFKLLNSFQSPDLESHSTKTALLSVHDYIIRAMILQQTICLCLPDLSAAFDTIDHSILIHRLSS
jgi:Reverse transcriptase (RNA-dependent DNA polymerase)